MSDSDDVRPGNLSDEKELYKDGEYSVIWGNYDGAAKKSLGVRWNGARDGDDKGYPKTFGNPVWYVEPEFLTRGILLSLLERSFTHPRAAGYRDAILAALTDFSSRYESNRIHFAVALYAASNRGKTQTLKKLVGLLKSNGCEEVEERAACEGSPDLLFCCKYNGKTVGVATGGDDGDALDAAFAFFNKYNCDFVFCATRSRSDSRSWQEFWANTTAKDIPTLPVAKRESDEPHREDVNAAQAEELLNLIH